MRDPHKNPLPDDILTRFGTSKEVTALARSPLYTVNTAQGLQM